MFKRGLALCLALGFASAANAGVNVELIKSPDKATYMPGEAVSVDVVLSQDTGVDRLLRFVQIDVGATNASLLAGATYPTQSGEPVGFWDCPGSCCDDPIGTCPPPTPSYLAESIQGGDRLNIGAIAYLDLTANAGQQIVLPADGTGVIIGTIDLMMPGSEGAFTLDVLNATGVGPDEGSEVRWGFGVLAGDDLTRCRADGSSVNCAGGLTGGTESFTVETSAAGAVLTSTFPANGGSLWRTQNNRIRMTFDSAPAGVPDTGEITIREMQDGGNFGPDLSGSFTYTQDGNDIIGIGTGAVLEHRKWYRVENTGTYPGVNAFSLCYVVQMGDAAGNGQVAFADLANINTSIPTSPAGINETNIRRDINGDNQVNFADLAAANVFIPSGPVPVPSDHTCP